MKGKRQVNLASGRKKTAQQSVISNTEIQVKMKVFTVGNRKPLPSIQFRL